jgi:diguanylate cyclase (GGDEF)-like protein/PAS domain S-box-containing protein
MTLMKNPNITSNESNIFPMRDFLRSQLGQVPLDSESKYRVPVNKLLQDLLEHQIDLELQNEVLQRAQEKIEESLVRDGSVYELFPASYIILTENSNIDELDLVSANLLGRDRSQLLRRCFLSLVAPEDRTRWNQFFNGVMQHSQNKSCEVKLLKDDGSQLHVRLDCLLLNSKSSLIYSPNAPSTESLKISVVVTDISEIKQVEQALRVEAIMFQSQEGMMVTDDKNIILRVNHAFTTITGYAETEVVGKTPNILSSSRHDTEFYVAMWSQLNITGWWQGEIWDRRKNGEVFPQWLTITAVKTSEGLVTNYVVTLTDITARKKAEDEMQLLAFYDPLTRLPNRRLLEDRLHRVMTSGARTGHYSALLFVDLDNFKASNDSLGHDVGDLMLKIVAQRLSLNIREGDTVARIGGDEFMVMLADLHESPDTAIILAVTIANKILAAINQPYILAGHECGSTASIGISLFRGQDHTIQEIQKRADTAMYIAKSDGKNRISFYKQ